MHTTFAYGFDTVVEWLAAIGEAAGLPSLTKGERT